MPETKGCPKNSLQTGYMRCMMAMVGKNCRTDTIVEAPSTK